MCVCAVDARLSKSYFSDRFASWLSAHSFSMQGERERLPGIHPSKTSPLLPFYGMKMLHLHDRAITSASSISAGAWRTILLPEVHV